MFQGKFINNMLEIYDQTSYNQDTLRFILRIIFSKNLKHIVNKLTLIMTCAKFVESSVKTKNISAEFLILTLLYYESLEQHIIFK